MKNIIIILTIITTTFTQTNCQNASAETTFGQPVKQLTSTAYNVTVGNQSVYAAYAEAEFILEYCGEVVVEIEGRSKIYPATVCQYEPGVWTATIDGGDYVKVWVSTGITNIEINGEFRTFVKS